MLRVQWQCVYIRHVLYMSTHLSVITHAHREWLVGVVVMALELRSIGMAA